MAASGSARRQKATGRSGGSRSRAGLGKPGQNRELPDRAQAKKGARGGPARVRPANGGSPARKGDRRPGGNGSGRARAPGRPGPGQLLTAGSLAGRPPEAIPALWLRIATLVLAIIGLADSSYITVQEESGGVLAGCSEKAGLVDCGAVIHSPESVIFGVPVAVFGIVFFVFMVAIMSPYAWRSARRDIWQLRLAAVFAGIGFVIYLIYAELFEVGNICLYCTSVHILTFLLFVLTMVAAAIWGAPPRSRRTADL
jgi:uncharacterized membrane protein